MGASASRLGVLFSVQLGFKGLIGNDLLMSYDEQPSMKNLKSQFGPIQGVQVLQARHWPSSALVVRAGLHRCR